MGTPGSDPTFSPHRRRPYGHLGTPYRRRPSRAPRVLQRAKRPPGRTVRRHEYRSGWQVLLGHRVDEGTRGRDPACRARRGSDSEHKALNAEWQELSAARIDAEESNDQRRDAIRPAGAREANRDTALEHEHRRTQQPGFAGEAREQGLRAVERMSSTLIPEAGDRLEDLCRRDIWGHDARYLAAVSDPAYESAF
jgi:hypothetical protein